MANATGGHFGSLCGDMDQNVRDIARAATGIVSEYALTDFPASASIRVAKGRAGQGVAVPRSRVDGWDYDAARNRVIFNGAARPKSGEEIVVGYRRWDWAGNTTRPPEACDACAPGSACDPERDVPDCVTACGDATCSGGQVCLPDVASCGEPGGAGDPGTGNPDTSTPCGMCGAGLVCDASGPTCVTPCEDTGCSPGQICSVVTHLCQMPNL